MTRDVNPGKAGFCPSADLAASQNPFTRIAGIDSLWSTRAKQRAELASLSPALHRDLGLSAADVWREARKPFWRE